jgi:hypothetical protein
MARHPETPSTTTEQSELDKLRPSERQRAQAAEDTKKSVPLDKFAPTGTSPQPKPGEVAEQDKPSEWFLRKHGGAPKP